MRPLINVGEINHQLYVVHAKRMVFPMRTVSMEALVGLAIIRSHVAKTDFGETDRPTHEKFNHWQNLGVAEELVKFRRGD